MSEYKRKSKLVTIIQILITLGLLIFSVGFILERHTSVFDDLFYDDSLPIYSKEELDAFFKTRTTYDFDIKSKYAYAKKVGDHPVLFRKDDLKRTAQASLTKLTTILVAFEYVEDWNALAPIDAKSYDSLIEQNSALVGFYSNEQTTYLDLLYGSLLNSGGEAITSLAVNAVGSEEEMIRLMNLKVEEWGLVNTHYASVVGLDTPNHYSCAHDIAIIFEKAIQVPLIRELMLTETHTTFTPQHPNGITMVSTVQPRIINDPSKDYILMGGKSGTSYAAGQNWATYAIIDGEEYISIIMNAKWNQNLDMVEDTHKVFTELALNKFR